VEKTHNLKIKPEHLIDLITGRKKAELRWNDRNYKVGDTIVFYEYGFLCKITHITNFPEALHDGYVCLSVTKPIIILEESND